MHMRDWIKKLDGFLSLNERDILTHAGKISHEMAKERAENEYDKFSSLRIRKQDHIETDFDKTIKEIALNKRSKSKKEQKDR
jgi:hypothetical protein